MTRPRLSVVMPTHDRAARLPETLSALAHQTLPADDYEVILVADGCTDDTAEVVHALLDALPFGFQFLEQAGQGAAAARNAGAARANAPFILFLDDDMLAMPLLLESHLREHAIAPNSLVLGYFPIPFDLAKDDPFARAARNWWDAGFAARGRSGYRFTFKDFCTGNISLPAELFQAVGGFDARIKGAGGEDYELGYRLLRRGARFRYARQAMSLHQDVNSLSRAVRRARAEGVAHAHTVQRHIELARSFGLHRLSRMQGFAFGWLWRLAWAHPRIADAGAAIVKVIVMLTRRLGWERLMWRVYPALSGHAYWRGVRQGLGSLAVWERLMQDAPFEPEDAAEIDIDLGAETGLESRLETHADAVRLWWDGVPLGRIASIPGAERLSAIHVRDEAVRRHASDLLPKIRMPRKWSAFSRPPHPVGIASQPARRFVKALVARFDLGHPEHIWGLQSYEGLRILVTDHGQPVADLSLPLHRGTAVLAAAEITGELERRGVRRGSAPQCAPAVSTTPVSVVVCTRDRPHALRRCLKALARLDHPSFEVIVVDNASANDATAAIVAQSSFRYVRENRPGLDWARNRGIAESRFEVVAFVDDDAVVEPQWLTAIAAALDDPAVSAVTGLVLPGELVSRAQHLFEQYGGMGKGVQRRDFVGSKMTALQKVAAHHAGVGANMAFRKSVFERVGGFDTALDVGTPAAGAGDLDMFHRILAANLTIRYEPAAFVWHFHRRETHQLRRQLYNNGRSFGVYLIKAWRSRSVARRSTLRYALASWLGSWLLARLVRVIVRKERFPVGLVLAEHWGASHALWAYAATYRADRKMRASAALPAPSISNPSP